MADTRRIRGMLGTALTWGVALSALATGSLALGLATGLAPTSIFGARELVAVAVRGLLLGGVFGWLLTRRARGQSLAGLSPRRVAVWGFIAGASVAPILALAAPGPVLPLGLLVASAAGYGGLGALLSTATLRIARRAQAKLGGVDEESNRLAP